jgi:hypothetical protein
MSWAQVIQGEVTTIYTTLPASVTVNGQRYDRSIFRNPSLLRELGILELIYPEKPDTVRYRIVGTAYEIGDDEKVRATYITEENPIDAAKERLFKSIKPSYDAKLKEGWVYNGNRYDIDDRSVMFIDIESRAAEIPSIAENWPENYAWRDFDNNLVSFTAEELVEFSRAARLYRLQLQAIKWQHEASISALTTHTSIANYTILWEI